MWQIASDSFANPNLSYKQIKLMTFQINSRTLSNVTLVFFQVPLLESNARFGFSTTIAVTYFWTVICFFRPVLVDSQN